MVKAKNKDLDVLKEARLASMLTQSKVAQSFGCSAPTIVNQEKRPDMLSLNDLSKWYNIVSDDGKLWIKEFVDSFFIVENANN